MAFLNRLLHKIHIHVSPSVHQQFTLKTYAAISNAHLSRVCKRGKLSGSCLSTLTDSDQHSFRYFYVISVFRHFLHKITNQSVFEISIDIFSEQIVSAIKTDKCSLVVIKRRTQKPWLRIRQWPRLYYLYGYFERRTT